MNLRTRIKTDGTMIVEQTSGDHAGEFVIECDASKVIAQGLLTASISAVSSSMDQLPLASADGPGLMSADSKHVVDTLELRYPVTTFKRPASLIPNALVYYDFSGTAVAAVKITGLQPNVNAFSAISGWSKTQGFGPDGGYDWAVLTESGTSARYLTNSVVSDFGPGFARQVADYTHVPQYASRRYRLIKAALGDVNFLHLLSKTEADGSSTADYVLYQASAEWYQSTFNVRHIGNGVLRITSDANLYHTGAAWGTQSAKVATASSCPALSGAGVFALKNVTMEQERVAAVYPTYGDSTYALTQTVNLNRPTVGLGIWVDGGRVLVDSCGIASSISGALPARTALTVSCIHFTRQPFAITNARRVLRLSGTTAAVELSVGTTGYWEISHTDDAGVTTTATSSCRVAPVPVHVALVKSGATLRLYVDGRLYDTITGLGVTTITGQTVLGGQSQSQLHQYGVHEALADTDVSTLSAEARQWAGLPSVWPAVLHTGQSNNGDTMAGATTAQGMFVRGDAGYARYSSHVDARNTTHRWFASAHRNKTTDPTGGLSLGWAQESYANRDPWVAISLWEGGRASTAWLDGGDVKEFIRTELPAALASFGTHLIELRALTVIQGEAECVAGVGNWTANWTDFVTWLRANYGAEIRAIFMRPNAWLGTTADQAGNAYAADVRAACDTLVATLPNAASVRLDGGQWVGYNVHYHPYALRQIGRLFYQEYHRLAHNIDALWPEWPQQTTWSTGDIWDCESGIITSGGTVLGAVSVHTGRESSRALAPSGTVNVVAEYSQNALKALRFNQSGGGTLVYTDASIGANFSGTNKPLILFVQFSIDASANPANADLIALTNAAGSNIAAKIAIAANVAVATRSDGSTTATRTGTESLALQAPSHTHTLVALYGGSNLYLVDASGAFDYSTAATYSASVTVDRLVVGSTGTNVKIRRFGYKIPISAAGENNYLGEAITLHQTLRSLL